MIYYGASPFHGILLVPPPYKVYYWGLPLTRYIIDASPLQGILLDWCLSVPRYPPQVSPPLRPTSITCEANPYAASSQYFSLLHFTLRPSPFPPPCATVTTLLPNSRRQSNVSSDSGFHGFYVIVAASPVAVKNNTKELNVVICCHLM